MFKRYLFISYTVKEGNKEFHSCKGYILGIGEPIPSSTKIRNDCLEWANQEGDNFQCLKINQMTFLNKKDYNSFFEIK